MEFLQPRRGGGGRGRGGYRRGADRGRNGRHGGDEVRPEPTRGPARPDPGTRADRLEHADELLRVGAGASYATLITELGDLLPGLAMASRTVARRKTAPAARWAATWARRRPPVTRCPCCWPRRRGGDRLGAGIAPDRGRGPLHGVNRTRCARRADRAVLLRPARGPQQFCKVGTRNAMVIAVASVAVELDPARRG